MKNDGQELREIVAEEETDFSEPNLESLQAIQETKEFFSSGKVARFKNPQELFEDLDI